MSYKKFSTDETITQIGGMAGAALLPDPLFGKTDDVSRKFEYRKSPLSINEPATSWDTVTQVNNFYEFGLSKDDPAKNAKAMKTSPWQMAVEGEIHKPQVFDIDDLLKIAPLEERIYRLRCVEAWSWIGYSLHELIRRVGPTGNAKYVEFISLADPGQMTNLKSRVLDWPYREALRMDEAMNPLTLLCFGLYGKVLPNQNGGPTRIITPWKYGFKSGKSIVKIRFVEYMPQTSWMRANSHEYGFYANVNPVVPHPRWSQSSEVRFGEKGRRKTLLFNGYDDHVASLYQGMDLSEYY